MDTLRQILTGVTLAVMACSLANAATQTVNCTPSVTQPTELNNTITCTGLAGTGITAAQVTGITFEVFGSVNNPPSSISLTNNNVASHSGFAFTDSEFVVTGVPAGVTLPTDGFGNTFGVSAGTCSPISSNCVTLAGGASTAIGVSGTGNTGVLSVLPASLGNFEATFSFHVATSTTTTVNFGGGNVSSTQVTTDSASAVEIITFTPLPPSLTCSAVSSGVVGVPFNSPAPTVTGGTPAFTFSITSGALPNGLTLNTTTGAVTGTPTAAGTFSIGVRDSTGLVATTTCPFVISAAAPPQVSFLVRYAANLNIGESYVDITNTGANGCSILGPGFGAPSGNICVNTYAFDPGEELISCCSCLVTCDQTSSLGVNRDLTVKTLTGAVPTSVTIKLVATLAGGDGTGTSCTNSAAAVTTATLTGGLAAWGTTLHATPAAGYDTTETPFTGSTLSQGELNSIGGRCAAILGNGSGFGLCNSCRAGALGASRF